MIYDSYELKKALPEGIICEVINGHWAGDLWVKTGESKWSSIPKRFRGDAEQILKYAEEMRAKGEYNVSPNPAESLKVWFNETNVNKVLGMMAGTIERADRLQRIVNDVAVQVFNLNEATSALRSEVRINR